MFADGITDWLFVQSRRGETNRWDMGKAGPEQSVGAIYDPFPISNHMLLERRETERDEIYLIGPCSSSSVFLSSSLPLSSFFLCVSSSRIFVCIEKREKSQSVSQGHWDVHYAIICFRSCPRIVLTDATRLPLGVQ